MTGHATPGQPGTTGGNGSGPELDAILRQLDRLCPSAGRAARAEMQATFAHEPQAWQFSTLADAYAPRPPLEYVVSGLFPLPSLSIVYGAPGTLKSMLMIDMATCVAAGLPWLPPLPDKEDVTPRKTLQVPVLWCDFDNGQRRTDERIEAMGRARDLEPDTTPLHYVAMPTPWLVGSDPASVDILKRSIDQLGAKLVILDNLSPISGDADENSSAMGRVMANFRRVTEDTGAALILIHHQRKSKGHASRAGESLRGHSSIEAAIDLALLIERKEHADTVQVKSTKARGVDVSPFAATFAYEPKPGTAELYRARFFGRPAQGSSDDAQVADMILQIVGQTPRIAKTKLVASVRERLPDAGVNRVGRIVGRLVAEGEVTEEKGSRNAKLYSLPTKQA